MIDKFLRYNHAGGTGFKIDCPRVAVAPKSIRGKVTRDHLITQQSGASKYASLI